MKQEKSLTRSHLFTTWLALSLFSVIAFAGEPIPGVDVNLGKNPGGAIVTTRTGKDGSFKFTGLTPGKYDLRVKGQPDKLLSVGADGIVNGSLTKDSTGNINFFSCCISIEHHDGVDQQAANIKGSIIYEDKKTDQGHPDGSANNPATLKDRQSEAVDHEFNKLHTTPDDHGSTADPIGPAGAMSPDGPVGSSPIGGSSGAMGP
ncbi:MAG TPA: carboxypeptidase-like regulatory domain-containing protein [Pseudomonadales bacterium]|nr:carboxypeptidase-like regulatory domain-containing protein [Pseudomonadales bacterium]